MMLNRSVAGRWIKNSIGVSCVLAMGLTLFAGSAGAWAQTKTSAPEAAKTYATLYVPSSTNRSNFYDIETDIRNMLPHARIFGVLSQNAISIYGTAEDITLARRVLADMSRPTRGYRLTYTITETGGGPHAGTLHEALTVVAGETATVKQGDRVPIVTGSYDSGNSKSDTQVQYLDVGLNIKATLEGDADALVLHSQIEQSSVAEEKAVANAQDPVIHQATLDVTSRLVPGKTVALGSLDVPGGARRIDISVNAEPVAR